MPEEFLTQPFFFVHSTAQRAKRSVFSTKSNSFTFIITIVVKAPVEAVVLPAPLQPAMIYKCFTIIDSLFHFVCKNHSPTSQSATVPVSEEIFTPILQIFFPLDRYSVAYPISSICCKAATAEPSSLNSKI